MPPVWDPDGGTPPSAQDPPRDPDATLKTPKGASEQPSDLAGCYHLPVPLPGSGHPPRVSNTPIWSGTIHSGTGSPMFGSPVLAQLPLCLARHPSHTWGSPKAHTCPWTRPSRPQP